MDSHASYPHFFGGEEEERGGGVLLMRWFFHHHLCVLRCRDASSYAITHSVNVHGVFAREPERRHRRGYRARVCVCVTHLVLSHSHTHGRSVHGRRWRRWRTTSPCLVEEAKIRERR